MRSHSRAFRVADALPRPLLAKMRRRIQRAIVRNEPHQAMLDWADVQIAKGWAVRSVAATRSAPQGVLRRLFRRCYQAVRALLPGC